MLTTRARWVLAIAAGLAVLSLLVSQDALALACLSIVVWIGFTWLGFTRQVSSADRVLTAARRKIDGQEKLSLILTVDEVHQIELSTNSSANLSGLRLWLEDLVPPGCSLDGTSPAMVAEVTRNQRLAWQYKLKPSVVGKMVLPGIQVRLTDPFGLLQEQRFVPLRQELTVLPFLLRPQTTVSVLKPKNSQLLLGQHRHHNPGISGELLSIREYQPGDAPKTIAWKASARLGRLMTCEYESEVPIRATIVCDLSSYQFAGRPGPAMADRVVSIGGSLARLLLSNRDPVGGVIVNESNRWRVRHAQGERQLTRLLHSLLAHVSKQSFASGVFIDELVALTWTACFHRFPELFDARVNPQSGLLRLTTRRRMLIRRRQLCFALSQHYSAPVGFAQRLMEDDTELREVCHRFLTQHPSYRVPPVAIPDIDRYWHAHRSAMTSVGRAVIEGVAKARDNELFVLVGAMPLDKAELGELEKSLRVARAAHHRVVVLGTGVESSGDQMADATARTVFDETMYLTSIAMRAETEQCLGRLGVKVADADRPSLTEEIAAEVELLRFGRARFSAASRG